MNLTKILNWVKTHPNGNLLAPQKAGDVGYDLVVAEIERMSACVYKVDFGVAIELPPNYHAEIVARSSTYSKYGLMLTNSIGIIDNGYRGSLKGIFLNEESALQFPAIGDRIAQLLIRESHVFPIAEVTELSKTERGTGGYGSTGR